MTSKTANINEASLFEQAQATEKPKSRRAKTREQAPVTIQLSDPHSAGELVASGSGAVADTAVALSRPGATADSLSMMIEFMRTIERIAMNPAVDAQKLEPILAMQERIMDRQAKQAFNEAFVKMAPKFPMITKDGRIVVKEKTASGQRDGKTQQDTPYAKWEAISPIVIPILAEHGFSLRHRTETAPDGKIRITAVLWGYGHQEESYMDFEVDATGSKNNAQGRVSATTYGRRITGCTVLNIVTKGEDDDGKSSGLPLCIGEPLSEEQFEELVEFAESVNCAREKLVKHLNSVRPRSHPEMDNLRNLPTSRFKEAINVLKEYDAEVRARCNKPNAS